MKAKDIMCKDVACCTPEMGLQRVAQMMIEHDCGSLPVIESPQNRKLVGIITDRDIVCRSLGKGRNPLEMTAKDCMSSPAVCVGESTSLKECCELMEKDQIRRLVVADENGIICGIISQADVALHSSAKQAGEVVACVSQPSEEASSIHSA